jgi:hypothetical protein
MSKQSPRRIIRNLKVISLTRRRLRRAAIAAAAAQAAAPQLEQLVDQADAPPGQEPDDEPPTGD